MSVCRPKRNGSTPRAAARRVGLVFVQQVFPMPEGAARYVWYQGTESANNELNAIGLLKPNPLGLRHAGQRRRVRARPFRLNKLSRLHGQAGGATVKGGDYRTPLDDIRSAAREEFVPIDGKERALAEHRLSPCPGGARAAEHATFGGDP